ncbi:MAG: SgcJ/EcaC family oxidoreductase [Nitrososphaeraceae archaeon]
MSDEISKINTLIKKFTIAWNRHDAEEFAELFVDDGEWTDVLGQRVKRKEQIEKLHEYPFKSVLKDATLTIISIRNRFITKDIFAIDVEWKTTGNKTPDGKPIPDRNGLLDLVVTLEGGSTRIILGHNVDYTTAYSRSDLIKDSKYTDAINSR